MIKVQDIKILKDDLDLGRITKDDFIEKIEWIFKYESWEDLNKVEDLEYEVEDLKCENRRLEDRIEELKEDIETNG